jgi:aldose 1-epimerase
MKISYLAVVGVAATGLVACDSEPTPGPNEASVQPDVVQNPPDRRAHQPGAMLAQRDVAQTRAAVGQPEAQADSAQGQCGQRFNAAYVELRRENFQSTTDAGQTTDLYTIKNSKGMFAKITNYGAKFEQIVVPDKDNVFGDVILGYETLEKVKGGQPSMGAFIGRYANRIGGGTFTLDGIRYGIAVNEPPPRNNLLHGGAKGGRFRIYESNQLSDAAVQMSLTYADAEDADPDAGLTGFPGTVTVTTTYSVTETNEIHIDYTARTSDKKTVINLTSHSFFNLSNTPTASILDHVITVNADKVLVINDRLLPTGELRDVTSTPMEFRSAKTFRKDYAANYDLLNLVGGAGAGVAGGYDNHYALNKAPSGGPTTEGKTTSAELTFAASAYEPISGRKMEVWTTEPGMQLFTGQNLTGQVPRDVGKGNVTYQQYSGFCMEPSHFPDSPNQPGFPTTTIGSDDTYQGQIVYKFRVVP